MLFKLINFLFDIPDKAKGLFFKRFCKNYTKRIETNSKQEYSRFAIVCIYDKTPRPDLISLFSELKKAGFGIIAALSNDADSQYADLIDIKVHVSPVGRDFLAYQQGYRALKQLGHTDAVKSVCFLNDSVWYFEKHQQKLIGELMEGMDSGKLTVGTKIFDDIPHVSGWLFGSHFDQNTIANLDLLFLPNFARKSREYNIRKGEHKILTSFSSTKGIKSLDKEHSSNMYAYCYTAIAEGLECFYLKADATLRMNPSSSKLEEFLSLNATEDEYYHALRWITSKADALLNSPLRRAELSQFRKHHFVKNTH